MSISRSSSSCIRCSIASSTRIFLCLVRPWKRFPNMSFMLIPISSTPCGPASSITAKFFSRALKLILRGRVSSHFRTSFFSRGSLEVVKTGTRTRRRQQHIEDSFLDIQLCFFGDFIDLFLPGHVYRDFREVPNHAFHVTADIAHLSKLGSLDFQKGRVRHAR